MRVDRYLARPPATILAQQSRPAVNVTGVNLEKLRAGFQFLLADAASTIPPEAITGMADLAVIVRTNAVDFSRSGAPLNPPS